MGIDLFHLVDGLFSGIVFFFYNLVETTVIVLRHPIRGPNVLSARHARRDTRQLGGLTYLFLAFMLFHWAQENLDSGLPLLGTVTKWLGQMAATVPAFNINAMWPIAVAALITTVIIDAAIRLLLTLRFPRHRHYKSQVLSATEYALVYPILATTSVAVLGMLADHFYPRPLAISYEINDWSGFPIFLTFYPSARILRDLGPGWFREDNAEGIRVVGMFLLFILAAVAGAHAYDEAKDGKARQPSVNQAPMTKSQLAILHTYPIRSRQEWVGLSRRGQSEMGRKLPLADGPLTGSLS